MLKKKPSKPEFYRTFMQKDFFPNSNKVTRYEESDNYWLFKTGIKIYKIKKKSEAQSSVSLEEIFCHEIVRQLQIYSPQLEARVFTVKKEKESYVADWDNQLSSKPLYYAIEMNQLVDRGFLSSIIEKNRLKNGILDQVVAHLAECHNTASVSQSKDDGAPDTLNLKLENLYYQSKKYLGVTVTKAMIDMTLRPLEKYLVDNRKVFLRRIKQNRIRLVHGCFIPRKIHATKEGVHFLGKTSDPLRNRYADIVSDLSDLTVELRMAGLNDFADYFIQAYSRVSEDKEIGLILPIYEAIRCLNIGLKNSILIKDLDEDNIDRVKQLAIKYYEQTIEVVRGL